MAEAQENVRNLRNQANRPSGVGQSKEVLDADTNIFIRLDGHEDSGAGSGYVIGQPTVRGVLPVDEAGNRGQVTADGELRVVQYADGLPIYGLDAAGADTYVTLVTTGKRCHNLWVSVATKDAILSLNGGVADHFFIPLGQSQLFTGLDIPPGSVIQGKNGVAGQNYANLSVSVW